MLSPYSIVYKYMNKDFYYDRYLYNDAQIIKEFNVQWSAVFIMIIQMSQSNASIIWWGLCSLYK